MTKKNSCSYRSFFLQAGRSRVGKLKITFNYRGKYFELSCRISSRSQEWNSKNVSVILYQPFYLGK